ncbi:hypothetical protein HPB49_015589 [Dermacentor silvarum]|uniref:Uncharacterized protein n=1 Tax=Dermacentor silvarum TaxID=543639 RepID=A0ACB8DEI3_DERSI|nr:hypothetical protein HPB49_015589 [Dermacentor silvarum]
MSTTPRLASDALQSPVSPTPSTPVPQVEKNAFCTLPCIVVSTASFVLVLVTLAFLSFSGGLQRVSVSRVPSCCMREIEAMYQQLNFSASPCSFFYHHVCDSYGDDSTYPAISAFKYYFRKELYEAPEHRAGKAFYELFQSCLKATVNAHNLGGSTAATYISVLQADRAMHAQSTQEILAFILRMTVKYDIWAHPILAIYGRGGYPTFLFFAGITSKKEFLAVVVRKAKLHLEPALANGYAIMRRDCLEKINELLRMNVTLHVIEQLERELDLGNTELRLSSNSILAEIAPPLTIDDWNSIAWNVTGDGLPAEIYHATPGALRKIFSVVLNITRKSTILVFLIFKAIDIFLTDHIQKSMRDSSNRGVFLFCEETLANYGMVAVFGWLERMNKNQDDDAAFRHMFRNMVQIILKKTSAIMPPKDQQNISSYLASLKMLLPSEVFPLQRSIPNLTGDYVKDRIALFSSGWGSMSYKPPPGVSKEMSQAATSKLILVVNRTVVVPILYYGALNISKIKEPTLIMSAIGVKLADVIWNHIFLYHNWSDEATRIIANYKVTWQKKTKKKHRSLPVMDPTTDASTKLKKSRFRRRRSSKVSATSPVADSEGMAEESTRQTVNLSRTKKSKAKRRSRNLLSSPDIAQSPSSEEAATSNELASGPSSPLLESKPGFKNEPGERQPSSFADKIKSSLPDPTAASTSASPLAAKLETTLAPPGRDSTVGPTGSTRGSTTTKTSKGASAVGCRPPSTSDVQTALPGTWGKPGTGAMSTASQRFEVPEKAAEPQRAREAGI